MCLASKFQTPKSQPIPRHPSGLKIRAPRCLPLLPLRLRVFACPPLFSPGFLLFPSFFPWLLAVPQINHPSAAPRHPAASHPPRTTADPQPAPRPPGSPDSLHPPVELSIPAHHPLPLLPLHTHPIRHRQCLRPQRTLLMPRTHRPDNVMRHVIHESP